MVVYGILFGGVQPNSTYLPMAGHVTFNLSLEDNIMTSKSSVPINWVSCKNTNYGTESTIAKVKTGILEAEIGE